jgi:hypothetical protein
MPISAAAAMAFMVLVVIDASSLSYGASGEGREARSGPISSSECQSRRAESQGVGGRKLNQPFAAK